MSVPDNEIKSSDGSGVEQREEVCSSRGASLQQEADTPNMASTAGNRTAKVQDVGNVVNPPDLSGQESLHRSPGPSETNPPTPSSAPLVRTPHNSGEILPNGDTAGCGAETNSPAALVDAGLATCPCCYQSVARPDPGAFVAQLNLSRIQKRFLQRLAESFGCFVDTARIADAVWFDDPNGGPLNAVNDLSVHKVRVKAALEGSAFAVEGVSRRGYRLIWRDDAERPALASSQPVLDREKIATIIRDNTGCGYKFSDENVFCDDASYFHSPNPCNCKIAADAIIASLTNGGGK